MVGTEDLGPSKNSMNYAPTMIARHPAATGFRREELERAQQRLLDFNKIHIKVVGPPSKQRKQLFAGPDPNERAI